MPQSPAAELQEGAGCSLSPASFALLHLPLLCMPPRTSSVGRALRLLTGESLFGPAPGTRHVRGRWPIPLERFLPLMIGRAHFGCGGGGTGVVDTVFAVAADGGGRRSGRGTGTARNQGELARCARAEGGGDFAARWSSSCRASLPFGFGGLGLPLEPIQPSAQSDRRIADRVVAGVRILEQLRQAVMRLAQAVLGPLRRAG